MNKTFVSLYHWMLRRRLLSERRFGQPRLVDRLLRIRWLSALMLSAPALALCLWYLWLAADSHYRHVAEAGPESGAAEPLTAELLQLLLHDRLSQDYRRLSIPEATGTSPLPTYGLVVGDGDLEQLDRLLPPDDGKAYYVPAYLTHDGQVYEVEVRYRGTKPWHWNYPQKSWKVRMKGARELDELSTFNFINTPDPMPFSEQMMLDIASEQGLLTPAYYPIRLLLNRGYLGVYFFETQPSEGLLRRAGRVPGGVYSGSEAPFDPKTGISTLWRSAAYWKTVANAEDSLLGSGTALEALINKVNFASAQEFADFAGRYLDLDKFALFDALDVVFGCDQHDYAENHKLYFDPYRGRFEPIATELRNTKHEPQLNRTENPLLLRLKQLPSYLPLRDKIVHRLLGATCSPEALRARTRGLLKKLEPDQIRDPYWDAYEQLPAMGDYYRRLMRPMDRAKQARAAEAKLHEFDQRVAFLRSVLPSTDVRAELRAVLAPSKAPSKPALRTTTMAFDVTVNGQAGATLQELLPSWSEPCRPERWELYADQDLSDDLDPTRDRSLQSGLRPDQAASMALQLTSGVAFQPAKSDPSHGSVRTAPEARRYRFFVTSTECQPARVSATLAHLTSGATIKLDATETPSAAATPAAQAACGDGRYRLEAGQTSPHPWCYRLEPTSTVTLGPGQVEVAETRVFGPNDSVTVLPGTTFRLADRASLIFYGRVDARGTAKAPIRFEPAVRRWGGVALLGPATKDSRLEFVEFHKGSHPTFGLAHFPGMVNIHDTSKVALSHVTFTQNQASDQALHIAYAWDTTVRDATFRDLPADALAVDMSGIELDGLTIVNAAQNCINARRTTAEIRRARLVTCRAAALSADDSSQVAIRDSLAADASQGILLKGDSTASVDGVLLYRHGTGVRIEPSPAADPNKSRVQGSVLHAVRCDQTVSYSGKRQKTPERVTDELSADDLETLRSGVLGLRNWIGLDALLDSLRRGEEP